jgi:hypothetical protein
MLLGFVALSRKSNQQIAEWQEIAPAIFCAKKRPKPCGLRDINQGASTSYLYSWWGGISGGKF